MSAVEEQQASEPVTAADPSQGDQAGSTDPESNSVRPAEQAVSTTDEKPTEQPSSTGGDADVTTSPHADEEAKPAEESAEEQASGKTDKDSAKQGKKGRRRRRRRRNKSKTKADDAEEPKSKPKEASKDEAPKKSGETADYVLQPVKPKGGRRTNRRRNNNQQGQQRQRRQQPPRGRGGYHHPPPPGMYPPYMHQQGPFPRNRRGGPPMGPGHFPPHMHMPNYLPCDYEAVRRQLEYYFGEINLARDQFIRSHMDPWGYVPANVMSGFPRMRNGMITPGEILHAASRSPLLEIRSGAIRSKRLWRRFANLRVQAATIQSLQRRADVGDFVRPKGDDIPADFENVKCVIKKRIDGGRKSLIARADDGERCAIVLSDQLAPWSAKGQPAPAKPSAPAKEEGAPAKQDVCKDTVTVEAEDVPCKPDEGTPAEN